MVLCFGQVVGLVDGNQVLILLRKDLLVIPRKTSPKLFQDHEVQEIFVCRVFKFC